MVHKYLSCAWSVFGGIFSGYTATQIAGWTLLKIPSAILTEVTCYTAYEPVKKL